LQGAFDLGITHFDLANNYGDPPGNAEIVCGKVLLGMPRDELIISSKAGCPMWPGPYGDWGSRKHLIASCEQSLKRTGLEYFDIFYSHRADGETPIEETIGALEQIVRQGKAIYVGVSNYEGAQFTAAVRAASEVGLKITIDQPHFNMLSRKAEWDLFPQTMAAGSGVIVYCPLASGLLTGKYTSGKIPEGSRAAEKWGQKWLNDVLTKERQQQLTALQEMACKRGQSLAQMTLAWTLRNPAITSALVGASSLKQIQDNVKSLEKLDFTEDELNAIERIAPAR
jgi:L-glyceraldehyde 3-phosphate reductase